MTLKPKGRPANPMDRKAPTTLGFLLAYDKQLRDMDQSRDVLMLLNAKAIRQFHKDNIGAITAARQKILDLKPIYFELDEEGNYIMEEQPPVEEGQPLHRPVAKMKEGMTTQMYNDAVLAIHNTPYMIKLL